MKDDFKVLFDTDKLNTLMYICGHSHEGTLSWNLISRGPKMKEGQNQHTPESLLGEFLSSFSGRIQHCTCPSVLDRLNTALGGIGEDIDEKNSPRPISAGRFTRHQIPSLLEHLGAESKQGVLLMCGGNPASEECIFTLWFQNGALIHSEGQGSLGRVAVKACCRCKSGFYLYTEISALPEFPASLPGGRGVTFLLLDILREIDEERHREKPQPPIDHPPPTEVPSIQLDQAQFSKLMRLVEAVREGFLMQHRAELDAWYYRQGSEKATRYTEIEHRALGRLYQWMAANGLMAIVNELQELPSTKARCEHLTELLDQLSATIKISKSDEDRASSSSTDDTDWSILEEDGSAL